VNIADLVSRSKAGTVSTVELAEVARAIEAGAPDSELYYLLYVLGRSFSYEHEELIARYIEYPADPWVARCAIEVLCRMWSLQPKYAAELRRFIAGVKWDEGEVRQIALAAAGEYLTSHVDTEMLELLLNRADPANESALERQIAVEALAVALGAPLAQVVKHDWSQGWDEWAATQIQHGAEQLSAERHGPVLNP
jgi:hypothetical protein